MFKSKASDIFSIICIVQLQMEHKCQILNPSIVLNIYLDVEMITKVFGIGPVISLTNGCERAPMAAKSHVEMLQEDDSGDASEGVGEEFGGFYERNCRQDFQKSC